MFGRAIMFKWLFKNDKKTTCAPQPQHSPNASNESGVGDHSSTIHIALQHHQAGRLAEAEAAYHAVLAVDPDNFDALHLLGVIAYQFAKHEQAAALISQALSRNASNAPAHNNLGNVFRAQGKPDEALVCFRNALALRPDYVDAHISLSALFRAQGKLDEAVACYEKVLSLTPDSPTAYLNLGNLLEAQGKRHEAIDCYRRALALRPDFFEAQFNLGNVLKDGERVDEAVACYRKALALKPDSAAATINLGNVLKDQGKADEAIVCYERAIVLDPGIPEAHLNLGNAFKDQDRLDEAIACYRRTLALKPDLPDAHYALGNALKDAGKLDEAIACYRETLALKPDFPEADYALGNALKDQDRLKEVLECYRKALALKPNYAEARWALTMSQIPAVYDADAAPARFRTAFSLELDELDRWFDSTRIAEGFKAVGVQQPFCLAYQEENNRDLLRRYGSLCARLMSDWFHRQGFSERRKRERDGAIRIGVVSQYFHNHSVWNAIIKGWFQQLDRKRFSLHVFHLGSGQDQETQFAKANASHFEHGRKDLRQWVEVIIGQQPDVLIYPEVGMDPMTMRLASLRLAPVQVATWGHPETTGLPTIDYYLSAVDLEPPNAQDNYTERLVALPHLGCFYKPFPVAAASPDLHGLGIVPELPLLLCPGVPFKYAPQHDWVLTEIARRLGRCRFVFFTHRLSKVSEKLRQRLEIVFVRSGLDFDEFVRFIPWQSSSGFYGLMKRADVYLDTIGFSGFNTAMQAVECGVPIVTREGRFLRGRLASGILKRMGLPGLVAASEEDYIALVVKLAKDAQYRRHICERIEASRQVLFEDIAPIRALEDFLAGVTVRR